ncbi:MAG: hypothetical protein R3Y36_07585 [Spirochaetales bacterium]
MNETITWLDNTYRQAFEEETRGIERRRQHDPNLTPEDIQGTLNTLYVQQGNNSDGRGSFADAVLSATIAAYEMYIEKWKNEV